MWEVPPGERHLIVDELIAYALRRHLPMGTSVTTFGATLDGALTPAGGDLSEAVASTRLVTTAEVTTAGALMTGPCPTSMSDQGMEASA